MIIGLLMGLQSCQYTLAALLTGRAAQKFPHYTFYMSLGYLAILIGYCCLGPLPPGRQPAASHPAHTKGTNLLSVCLSICLSVCSGGCGCRQGPHARGVGRAGETSRESAHTPQQRQACCVSMNDLQVLALSFVPWGNALSFVPSIPLLHEDVDEMGSAAKELVISMQHRVRYPL